MSFKRFAVGGITLLLLTAVGCGRGSVTGKVTYKDKAVVFGTILFEGKDGPRQGNIAPDGAFSVNDLAVGEVKVSVNSPNPKGIQLYPNKNPKFKQEPYPDVPGWFAIPKQYETPASSGLSYPIKSGSNTINIELK